MTEPLALLRTGAVTCVGLDAPSTFAALRTRLNHFYDLPFVDTRGEPITAGLVTLGHDADRAPAIDKHAAMLARAIGECLDGLALPDTRDIPLLLCVAEVTRPGRIAALDAGLRPALERALERRFSPQSRVYAYGQAGAAIALNDAFALAGSHPFVLIAGVDSYASAGTLLALHGAGRVLSSVNTHGFIPGEAACAVLVARPGQVSPAPRWSKRQRARSAAPGATLFCTGLGIAREVAVIGSAAPNRAIALSDAIRTALGGLPPDSGAVGLRISGQSSEDFYAKEFALAAARTNLSATPLWMLADSLGETGAAAGLLALAWAYAAAHKGYAASFNILCLMAGDEGERSAALLSFGEFSA
ncbi:hypothetical protein INH39_21320 [Massilia violaceinigra]|uniref:Beta-ketoacyl synthase N-terminal domain-containing protein n=1 Tax=Massilia violaceinigra TaxID=2045208 RepID=A0ABY3ZZU4_9BURK|nr:hypothetical protein [Massilia violaceinigra]UOD28008.1 hypothetical protein INH39_21320 [Massilia violaceinigra]